MKGRVQALLLTVLLVSATAVASVNPPPRYVPAPKGRGYLLAYFNILPVGSLEASESGITDNGAPGGDYTTKIKWTVDKYELGATMGYGFGPLGFMRGTEGSISIPFAIRSYTLDEYTFAESSGLFMTSLHDTMKDKTMGSGISDVQASLMGLLYADPGAGTWLSGALKVSAPTGKSATEQYAKLLHGVSSGGPADGAGVPRIIPAISIVKSIARQRLFLNIEYALPIGKESFEVTTGESMLNNQVARDSSTVYAEEFTPGGVIAGTLALDTTLDLWGVAPGLEITFRQYGKTKWMENGVEGTAPTAGAPIHSAEFLNSSAWALGNIPLKATTEIEMALTGTVKLKASDSIKGGIVYVWNSYGSMIGAKMTFTNLFESVSEEEQLRSSGPGAKAMEMNVSPVFDAPPPPSGRIMTGVTTPVAGDGVTAETIAWAGKELRRQMGKVDGYAVMSEKEMAQLAETPCGGADCGANFGRVLKQQAMVVGRLEKAGKGFAMTLRMVDVAAGRTSSTASASGNSLDELRKAIPDLLKRLTSPAAAPAAR
jgi:hypothetical protein